MKVLIAFATIEGQTGKIAQFAEAEVRRSGREVRVVEVTDEAQDIPLGGIQAVILAAPVHERRHPEAFEVFLAGQSAELAQRRTLLISVSLSAAFVDGRDEANDYLVEMKMRTQFEPDAEALVAGAVRTSGYDYFQSQIVRHVVLRDRDYDPAAGEHEFTDWQELSLILADFLKDMPAD